MLLGYVKDFFNGMECGCVCESRLHPPDLWKRNGFEMYLNMMGPSVCPSVSESGVQRRKKEKKGMEG
jgi:hypothetical protein